MRHPAKQVFILSTTRPCGSLKTPGLRLAIDSALGRASTPSGLCRSWCLFAPVPASLKHLSLRSCWNGSKSWGTGRITREIDPTLGSGLFGESRQLVHTRTVRQIACKVLRQIICKVTPSGRTRASEGISGGVVHVNRTPTIYPRTSAM